MATNGRDGSSPGQRGTWEGEYCACEIARSHTRNPQAPSRMVHDGQQPPSGCGKPSGTMMHRRRMEHAERRMCCTRPRLPLETTARGPPHWPDTGRIGPGMPSRQAAGLCSNGGLRMGHAAGLDKARQESKRRGGDVDHPEVHRTDASPSASRERTSSRRNESHEFELGRSRSSGPCTEAAGTKQLLCPEALWRPETMGC
jgi:hypothetical protein